MWSMWRNSRNHIMVGLTYSDQFDILVHHKVGTSRAPPRPEDRGRPTATEFGRDPSSTPRSARGTGLQHRCRGRDQVVRHRRHAARHQAAQCMRPTTSSSGLRRQPLAGDRQALARIRHQGRSSWARSMACSPTSIKGAGPAADGMLGVALRDDGRRAKQRLGHEGGRCRAEGLGASRTRAHQRRLSAGLDAGDLHARRDREGARRGQAAERRQPRQGRRTNSRTGIQAA